MKQALAGLTVIVTRPALQAAALVAELRALGARTIEFPALEIEAIAIDPGMRAMLAPDAHDWVIYASANAVRHALRALPRPLHARVATIGAATARTLIDAGIRVDALPRSRVNSEGLLALPEFTQPRGLKILVLRGAGGREWLREELERRGATVRVAELYRRVPAVPSQAALQQLAAAADRESPPVQLAVQVSSAEVLSAFVGIVPAAIADSLRNAPLIVPGPRVAAAARQLGWRGSLVEAGSAEDTAMVAGLVAHARRGRPVEGA